LVQLGPPLPDLDATGIDELSLAWDDGGLWSDIEQLAWRFWLADDHARSFAWHHLVMAIGNFKRQRGRRLFPHLAAPIPEHLERVPNTFTVPSTGPAVTVIVGEPETWEALSKALPGSAVATTTTLLAALWPDDHFVFDWRVHAAATALRIGAGQDAGGIDPSSTSSRPISFADYRLVRTWILDTATIEHRRVADVERALYRLSQEVPPAKTSRTWQSYATEVSATLARTRDRQRIQLTGSRSQKTVPGTPPLSG
jgi:hypothetical protein